MDGTEHAKILVIGAGMAGLVAARLLQDSGFEVTILEARNRIGGRTWTDASLGVPLDLGASFIHGADHNPLTTWCQTLGVPIHIMTGGPNRFYRDGAYLRWETVEAQAQQGLAILESRMQRAKVADRPYAIAEIVDPILADENLPLLDRQVVAWLTGIAEGVQAATAQKLGIEWWSPKELHILNALIPDGYQQLVDDVAQGLDIRLNTPVTNVLMQSEGVVAITPTERFRAKRAVIAVPLSILQTGQIEFDPPLPERKVAAIQRLGYGKPGQGGVLNKIYLRFATRFWEPSDERFVCLPDPPSRRGLFASWFDLSTLTGQPVLLSFSGGANGARLDQTASDETIYGEAMYNLRSMFGASIPEAEQYVVTRWLSDRWALGSYSYAQVGTDDREDRLLYSYSVEGRLFFAGEGTDLEDFGTVQAALLSGERVAVQIYEETTQRAAHLSALPYR